MTPETRSGLMYVALSTTGYAMIPIFTKFIYLWSDLEPLDLAVWRFVFAVPLIWLMASLWSRFVTPPPPRGTLPRWPLLFTGLLIGGAGLAVVAALPYIDAGVYVVLFFTYPAMTGLLGVLTGHPLPMRGWVALALTTLGVALTVPSIFTGGLASTSALGVYIALFNAVLVALYMIAVGRITRPYPATIWTAVWSITGVVMLLGPLLLALGVSVPPSTRVWALFAGMSLFGTVLPVFGLTMGVRKLGAGRAAIIGTLEPVLVILLAAGLLDERLLPIQLLGAICIVGSILILEVRLPTRRVQPAAIETT
ncbi:MAG: DMT family transporter [Chloroflexota bacterium]